MNTLEGKELERAVQFLRMAMLVSERSKCASRQVGAVLVRDGSVISEGYNGSPRGCSLCQDGLVCPRRKMGFASGKGTEFCPAVHAEVNAIVQAARNGINTNGATLYAYCGRPCKNCMGILVNAGVKRIVCLSYGDNSGEYDEMSGVIAAEGGIAIDRVDVNLL